MYNFTVKTVEYDNSQYRPITKINVIRCYDSLNEQAKIMSTFFHY